MDISIRNGIVLENILQHIDVSSALKLSAVCKIWYEQINNDTVLWKRLVQLEQIEDPEYWYRVDDNEQWTLGTPCKSKNILLNYRRTYFCIKHNIYKKYEFSCDDNDDNYTGFFEFDGRTLLFTLDKELQIYKVINDGLQLFQTIDLRNHCCGYTSIFAFTNVEFIVIYKFDRSCIITYRLKGNKYAEYNQHSFDEFGSLSDVPGKLLHSNVLIVTFHNDGNYHDMGKFTVLAWNIPEDRVIFNAPNHEFLKHDNGIIFVYDLEAGKLVLYNEDFEVIYRINQSYEHGTFDVLVNDKLIFVGYIDDGDSIAISSWDKATGQIKTGLKLFAIDQQDYPVNNMCISPVNNMCISPVNNNIIITCRLKAEPSIECYNANLRQLWSHHLSTHVSYARGYPIFNKLLIITENRVSKECFIEFRDVTNGNVLFTTKLLYKKFWKFQKDLLVSHRNRRDRKRTVLLYR